MEKQICISKYIYDKMEFLGMNEDFYTDNPDILKYFIKMNVISVFNIDDINLNNVYNFAITKEKNENNEMVLHISLNGIRMIIKRAGKNLLAMYNGKYEQYAMISHKEKISYNNCVFSKVRCAQIDYTLKMTDNLEFLYNEKSYFGSSFSRVSLVKNGKINLDDFDSINKFKLGYGEVEDNNFNIDIHCIDEECPINSYLNTVFNCMSGMVAENMSRKRIKK